MNIISDLVNVLAISEKDLAKFAVTAPHRYKVYTIPKKNSSGRRVIAHPSKELKFIQRILVTLLGPVLEPNEAAFAYVQGKNIKTNALRHAGSKFLLKMDFLNFFPSITPSGFFSKLERRGVVFSEKDRIILTGLLFRRDGRKGPLVLSIGAPSSPMLSNYFMRDFDEFVLGETKELLVSYTRYADDLTFSTSQRGVLFDVPKIVSKALIENNYTKLGLNQDKTVFSSKAHNRHVTGITLTNDGGVSIGRGRKRLISAMIHKFKVGEMAGEEVPNLRGLLSFAEHVEPGFELVMIKKYGSDVINKIKN